MKILIASDIHGRLEATKKLLSVIDRENPGKIILLGDFLYNGPRNGVPADYDPMAVCEALNAYRERIVAVRGNCDSRIDSSLLSFPLNDWKHLEIEGKRATLTHGDLITPKTLEESRGGMLLNGHTHLYVLEKKDEVIFLNPGSIGFPKGGNPASYAIIEDGKMEIRGLEGGDTLLSLEIE